MLEHLREGPLTSRDLSGLLGIREKDVSAHLEHLVLSLKRSDEKLHVEPAECLGCGYIFADRKRLTRPSACPKCRAQRLEAPIFSLRAPSITSNRGKTIDRDDLRFIDKLFLGRGGRGRLMGDPLPWGAFGLVAPFEHSG